MESELLKPPTFTVSQFSQYIQKNLPEWLPCVWVTGELSEIFIARSGHVYAVLKDQESQFRIVMYYFSRQKINFELKDGLQVNALVQATLYKPKGEFQLVVKDLEPQGLGMLRIAFEKLKEKLSLEGLFSAERKKKIPKYPQTIGLITSADGAVLHDMKRVIDRRFPSIRIVVYSCPVQGAEAEQGIVAQLENAAKEHLAETYIIARGGGSLTDLWAFNTESVVRSVANFPWPIISAIGHETDFTLVDFAADLRAPTPSIAAELATPDQQHFEETLNHFQQRFVFLIRQKMRELETHYDQLDRLWGQDLVPTTLFLTKIDKFQFTFDKKMDVIRMTLSKRVDILLKIFAQQHRTLQQKLKIFEQKTNQKEKHFSLHIGSRLQTMQKRLSELETLFAQQIPVNLTQAVRLRSIDDLVELSEDQITIGCRAKISFHHSSWEIEFQKKL